MYTTYTAAKSQMMTMTMMTMMTMMISDRVRVSMRTTAYAYKGRLTMHDA